LPLVHAGCRVQSVMVMMRLAAGSRQPGASPWPNIRLGWLTGPPVPSDWGRRGDRDDSAGSRVWRPAPCHGHSHRADGGGPDAAASAGAWVERSGRSGCITHLIARPRGPGSGKTHARLKAGMW